MATLTFPEANLSLAADTGAEGKVEAESNPYDFPSVWDSLERLVPQLKPPIDPAELYGLAGCRRIVFSACYRPGSRRGGLAPGLAH